MLLSTKCQLFSLFTIDQNKSRKKCLVTLQRKKKPFFHFQKQSFSKTKKSHFSKGLTHAFNQKWLIFSSFTIDKKKRLEIILSDFAEKKEPFFTIKNKGFKVRKIKFFKRVNPCFWSKNVNFFVDVDLVKIRLDIMLSDFPQEKRNLLDYNKHNFSK